jgi:hypothetical protein
VPGTTRWNFESKRSTRIAVLEKDGDGDVCGLIRRVQNATSLVTRHLRRRTMAQARNIAFRNCPRFSPNSFHERTVCPRITIVRRYSDGLEFIGAEMGCFAPTHMNFERIADLFGLTK